MVARFEARELIELPIRRLVKMSHQPERLHAIHVTLSIERLSGLRHLSEPATGVGDMPDRGEVDIRWD